MLVRRSHAIRLRSRVRLHSPAASDTVPPDVKAAVEAEIMSFLKENLELEL